MYKKLLWVESIAQISSKKILKIRGKRNRLLISFLDDVILITTKRYQFFCNQKGVMRVRLDPHINRIKYHTNKRLGRRNDRSVWKLVTKI